MKDKLATAITVPIFFVLVTVCVAASGTPQKIGLGYDIEMSRMIPSGTPFNSTLPLAAPTAARANR